ncbi:hypothetical protein PENSPDRAFT_160851 [Peniophora sp. CONT]|nr:hypothetical protein PENSPDRAFT_160851 [Peniophora sp. CONT]
MEPVVRAGQNGLTQTDLARAQEAAMAELDAAFAAVADIRVAMNSLTPACRLPSVIVLQVLKLAQVVDPPRYEDRPYLGWLSLTQVSHLWRETALQCHALWSQVAVCLGQHWTGAFVTRSRTCPLHIRCNFKTTICPEGTQRLEHGETGGTEGWRLVEQAITHVIETASRRITTLDLEAPTSTLQFIIRLVEMHTSSLTSLTDLVIHPVIGHMTIQPSSDNFAATFNSLTRSSIPNTLPAALWTRLPSRLTSLTITSGGVDMDSRQARSYMFLLFLLLRRSTELVNLSLNFERLPSWNTISVPWNGRSVELRNLKTLSLSGDGKACLSIVRSLWDHRGLCKLDVAVTGANWESLCVDSILSATNLVSGPLHRDPFTSLSIAGSLSVDSSQLCLHARRAMPCRIGPESPPSAHPDLALRFTSRSLERDKYRNSLTKLMSSINITRVRSLYVSFPGLSVVDWSTIHWINLFHGAHAVQVLHIRGECSGLIHTLGISTGGDTPVANQQSDGGPEPVTDATRMVFPALRSLVFEDVDFNYVNARRVPAHQAFARVLSARAPLSGVPRELELRRCQLDQDSADWWESSVPARMRNWSAQSLRNNMRMITS